MSRHRACGALIIDNAILMVRHREGDRTYWTLPGGGVEGAETFEEACVREMREETGLLTRVVKLIWNDICASSGDKDRCYLLELDGDQDRGAALGFDPEEAHLPAEKRLLQGIAWIPLEDVAEDIQVARVLSGLRPVDCQNHS